MKEKQKKENKEQSPYSIKIEAAEPITVQDTGERLLSVQFQVLLNDELVVTRRHGFPISTTPEQLEVAMKAALDTFIAEQETSARIAVTDAENAQASETIAASVGKEITSE